MARKVENITSVIGNQVAAALAQILPHRMAISGTESGTEGHGSAHCVPVTRGHVPVAGPLASVPGYYVHVMGRHVYVMGRHVHVMERYGYGTRHPVYGTGQSVPGCGHRVPAVTQGMRIYRAPVVASFQSSVRFPCPAPSSSGPTVTSPGLLKEPTPASPRP